MDCRCSMMLGSSEVECADGDRGGSGGPSLRGVFQYFRQSIILCRLSKKSLLNYLELDSHVNTMA